LLPGESFEFIFEKDKLDKIRKVIAHNHGEVVSETYSDKDIIMKVRKVNRPEETSHRKNHPTSRKRS
jgi:hypothetical protein